MRTAIVLLGLSLFVTIFLSVDAVGRKRGGGDGSHRRRKPCKTTEEPTEEPTTQPQTEEPSTEPPTDEPTTQPQTEEPSTESPTEPPTEEPSEPNKCPKKCKCKHAYCGYEGVGLGCDNSCESYIVSLSRPVKCPHLARLGCICKHGYVRSNGICIPVEWCIKKRLHECLPHKCGVNEQPAVCQNNCNQKCNTLDKVCAAICIPVKRPFCVCKPGYVRSPFGDGQCLSEKVCNWVPKPNDPQPHCKLGCKKPNEHCNWSGHGPCDDSCNAWLKNEAKEYVKCPKGRKSSKCVCNKGYARDGDGNCIKVHRCQDHGCSCHEQRVTCKEQLTCRQSCSTCEEKCPTKCTKPKAGLCVCRNGLVRIPILKDNTCVPKEYCIALQPPNPEVTSENPGEAS